MARTMSNWEYRRLLADEQSLVGQRLEKAYELGPGLFRLDFGKRSLMVGLGAYLYLTDTPPPGPQQPTSTAMLMRKHLDSQRLVSFTAYQSDRIYVLKFISGWKIVLEQYAHGNLFLLDEKGLIVRPYHFKPTSKHTYQVGSPYVWPPSPPFALPPDMAQWKATQEASPSAKLESTLSRWPIGKLYTSEAIMQVGLDGQKKLSEITDEQAQALLQKLAKLLSKSTPIVYEKTGQSGVPVELSLVPLSAYSGPDFAAKSFQTWSDAIQYYFTRAISPVEEKESPEVLKLRHRLAEQETALARLEDEIKAFEPSVQWLEAHLSEVESRLHELQSAGKEAKALAHEKLDLKNKKLILKINE